MDTVTLDQKQISALEGLFRDVLEAERNIQNLKDRLLSILPAKYGSDAWWEKSDRESLKQYKKGQFKTFSSVEELMKELHT